MTNPLRVVLEIGPKGKRVVAAAYEWPGLDRWGTDEPTALAKLAAYLPRYAPVAERAGLADEFTEQRTPEIVERYDGNTSTDWWGITHVPSQTERAVLSEAALERRIGLVQAGWDHFDAVAARVSDELRPGPRGGGRSRDEIVQHVYGSERHQFWRKVGLRADDEVPLTPAELAELRAEFIGLVRAFNADGRPGRTWPIQYVLRRTGQHVMDHAWELEDRDLTP